MVYPIRWCFIMSLHKYWKSYLYETPLHKIWLKLLLFSYSCVWSYLSDNSTCVSYSDYFSPSVYLPMFYGGNYTNTVYCAGKCKIWYFLHYSIFRQNILLPWYIVNTHVKTSVEKYSIAVNLSINPQLANMVFIHPKIRLLQHQIKINLLKWILN